MLINTIRNMDIINNIFVYIIIFYNDLRNILY